MERLIIFLRGIDGGSILPIAFEILVVRWPRICFRIAFMVPERWYVARGSQSPFLVRLPRLMGI
jgi:hypothetical protein